MRERERERETGEKSVRVNERGKTTGISFVRESERGLGLKQCVSACACMVGEREKDIVE